MLKFYSKSGILNLFRLTEHFGFKKSFAEQDLKKFLQRSCVFILVSKSIRVSLFLLLKKYKRGSVLLNKNKKIMFSLV